MADRFQVFKTDNYNGKVEEGSYDTREEAELRLVDIMAYTISNFDEYEFEDIDAVREQGYERFGAGIIWIEEDGISPIEI